MAELRVNPTRMEMKRLQARYQTARKGHKLLKDKRDELMKRFLEVAREDRFLRERVEAELERAYRSFGVASAVSSPQMLEEALICPMQTCELSVERQNVMSVTVPRFTAVFKGGEGSEFPYGFAFTGAELDDALAALRALAPELLRMAELEKTAQLLAEEIERTRRRVNALEYILMPQYLEAIKGIKMKLDENERGNTTRLMKVKDMMLADLQKRPDDEDE